jgi:aryl-alcohol dehydrogenase-like predicted oxidoreductase
MLTLNFMLQTAVDTVLPLCARHDVGTAVMMPLNQAKRESGLVSVPAALECVRRHIAAGLLPAALPYTSPDLFDFLEPYSVPAAALRFVLTHKVNTCCVGMRTPERVRENLCAVDPPYLDPPRVERLRELFGRIQGQVR